MRVRIMKEQEDKFEVDSNWVMPQLAELLPDGGRLDHEVRKLHNTYFDTPGAGLGCLGSRCVVGLAALRLAGDSKVPKWDSTDGAAKRLASQDAAGCVGRGRGGSAGR